MNSEKEIIKRQNAVRFIKAAQELLDSEGRENISIRKIADKAGFHNSTIYLYFKDVDQLILLASLKYFNEYSSNLSKISTQNLPSKERFFSIWTFFAQTIFQNPKIFYDFFFGKYSDNLTETIKQYYEIFPEEQETYSPDIEHMYYGRNISERCMQLLISLAESDPGIHKSDLETINEITVSYLKYLLSQKCQNPSLDSDMLTNKLIQILKFVTNQQKR